MQQLRTLYMKLKLFNSTIIVTNMKRKLMTTINLNFVDVNHLLCLWHINNNVMINCKKSFNTKKEWDVFFVDKKKIRKRFVFRWMKITFFQLTNDLFVFEKWIQWDLKTFFHYLCLVWILCKIFNIHLHREVSKAFHNMLY